MKMKRNSCIEKAKDLEKCFTNFKDSWAHQDIEVARLGRTLLVWEVHLIQFISASMTKLMK